MGAERKIEVWYGRLEDAERFPDLAYWQSQDDNAKVNAAWALIEDAYLLKGIDIRESRLQRTVASLQRRED